MKKFISYAWFLLVLINKTEAYFESCDYVQTLSEGTPQININSPNYPNSYPPGSSCRYHLIAPEGYTINLECNIDIQTNGQNCDSEILYVSLIGDQSLKSSETFCGKKNFQRTSVEELLTLAYTSSNQKDGSSFTCLAKIMQDCDCGWSTLSKIVGGVEAQVNEFPFMVGIVHKRNIVCGGAIINSRYIVTAAHCIKARESKDVDVVVGEHDVTTGRETNSTVIYRIDDMRIHRNYDGDDNDIALLKTASDIKFSLRVGPICLPLLDQFNLFVGYPVEIMGWGLTEFGGGKSTVLLKTVVKVQDNQSCKVDFPNVNNTQICTYTPGKDSCQMDSGGPIVYRNSRMFLIGIISSGIGCASPTPSINTRITAYIDWIQRNTGGNFCKKSMQRQIFQ